MSRIDSILQSVREGEAIEDADGLTSSAYPCRVGASCSECGQALLYLIVPTYDLSFGHNRGFPLELAWAPRGWETRRGLLHVFRRFPLASQNLAVLECGNCTGSASVQFARDGGLLPIDTSKTVQTKIPVSRLPNRRSPGE